MAGQRGRDPEAESVPMRDLSDSELVRLLVAGNEDAMAVIFDRYYRLVMSVALRVVRDTGEAQDAVQIVFTDFYRQAKLFDASKGNLKSWLLQYAYGRSINRRRSLKCKKFYDQTQIDTLVPLPVSPETRMFDLESPEAKRLVEQLLASIGEKQRRVIELVCFQGMTLAETAALTGESLGNVQHAYYRGLEKLRLYLKKADQSSRQKERKARFSLVRKFLKAPEETNDKEVEIVRTRAL
jgi:RNA polymerase sigma-70 factor (ECF subfamily)